METVDALVTAGHPSGSGYFVRSQAVDSAGIFLEDRYCPSRDMIGRWIQMRVDRGQICGHVSIIEDVFSTRVVNGYAEVKVVFRHDGSYKDERSIEREVFEVFRHDYFGLIVDPHHLVTRIDPNAWFTAWIIPYKHENLRFRWRISKVQSQVEPQYTQPENDVAIVQGIVHDCVQQCYLVWSGTFPKRTIRVKQSICPPVDMLGRWVEVEVVDHNHARKVEIIKEKFETQYNRHQGVQVRVEFEHVDRYDSMELFHHNYFKHIWDPRNVLENVKRGARYRGWIMYYEQGSFTGWRLAAEPAPEGPLGDDRQGQSQRRISDSDRLDYFEQNNDSRNYSRRDFPEIVVRNRSRSPVGRGYSNCDVSSDSSAHSRRRSRSVGRQYSERVNMFPEDVGNQTRPPDSGNRNLSPDNQRSSDRSHWTISGNPGATGQWPLKIQRSENETKILERKMKLERIGEIFAFFCKDKQLRQAIRSMDVEQYDELIEITTVADS